MTAIAALATVITACSPKTFSSTRGEGDDLTRGIETTKRWECVEGTFLDVAAKNFGFRYLSDTAVLVNMFTGGSTKLSADFYPRGGCNPARERQAQETLNNADPAGGVHRLPLGSPQRRKGMPHARADGFGLDFALLGIATDSRRPIRDGDRLRQGDRFQIVFTPHSEAYVYIYAVDSTGWVQALYPNPEAGHLNPVRSGAAVFLPRSDLFYGLDDRSGHEEIWVLASPHERNDIADLLRRFPLGRPRISTRATKEHIRKHSVVKGAVVVDIDVVEANPDHPLGAVIGGADEDLPIQRLFHVEGREDITFSRWFEHE